MKQTLMRNTLDGKQLATVQKKLKRAEKRIAKATSRLSGNCSALPRFGIRLVLIGKHCWFLQKSRASWNNSRAKVKNTRPIWRNYEINRMISTAVSIDRKRALKSIYSSDRCFSKRRTSVLPTSEIWEYCQRKRLNDIPG